MKYARSIFKEHGMVSEREMKSFHKARGLASRASSLGKSSKERKGQGRKSCKNHCRRSCGGHRRSAAEDRPCVLQDTAVSRGSPGRSHVAGMSRLTPSL